MSTEMIALAVLFVIAAVIIVAVCLLTKKSKTKKTDDKKHKEILNVVDFKNKMKNLDKEEKSKK